MAPVFLDNNNDNNNNIDFSSSLSQNNQTSHIYQAFAQFITISTVITDPSITCSTNTNH